MGVSSMSIVVNLTKAKTIAHEKRRIKREQEFKPHDDIIAKQIPGADAIQTDIDNATTVDALKTVYDNASLGE
jgi:hypothetical protein